MNKMKFIKKIENLTKILSNNFPQISWVCEKGNNQF